MLFQVLKLNYLVDLYCLSCEFKAGNAYPRNFIFPVLQNSGFRTSTARHLETAELKLSLLVMNISINLKVLDLLPFLI